MVILRAGMWFNGVMGSTYGANYFERWNNPNGQVPIGSGAGSRAHGKHNLINQATRKETTTDKQSQGIHAQNRNIDIHEQGTFRNSEAKTMNQSRERQQCVI